MLSVECLAFITAIMQLDGNKFWIPIKTVNIETGTHRH